MSIWSKNAKISGKRINSTIGKAKAIGNDRISLEKTYKDVDDGHIAMIEVGSPSNPPMNTDYNGWLDTKILSGVFGAEEEGEITIRADHKLWVTMGKNEYWFRIEELDRHCPEIPNLDEGVTATFDMDPSQLASLAKKADYARIEAGTNKEGKKTVFVAFYDGKGKFIRGIDLKTPWRGEMATAMYPADYISRWDKLGKKAKVRMGDNYLLELTGEDQGVDYRYILAPRFEYTNKNGADVLNVRRYSNGDFGDENEREWYMSCNAKALPRNKNVVEMDRQRILSIYGTPEKFRNEVDSINADVPDAIYALFASCGDAYPRWMIGDYLATALGPDYMAYGDDEYDIYARLMARDGMEVYRNAKAISANRKPRSKGRR